MSDASRNPFIRKLETVCDLSAAEREALTSIPVVIRDLNADQDIVRERDRPSQCCIFLDGYGFRYKMMEEGKRQIFSFHVPGDMPDLQSLHLDMMDHNLATLVPSRVALVQHDILRQFLADHPRIATALWRDTLIDAAIFREWIANVGRRDAYPRIAHLICEMYVRLRAVGLTGDDMFEMPITQEELGDATGLSTVHVNRTMQQLRAEGLIATPQRKVLIKDWKGLQQAGQFDETYLHIRKAAA